jgi:hypothetical protein
VSEWITHRLPTEADIDRANEVLIPWKPGCTPDSNHLIWQNYRCVVPGQPWWPGNLKARENAAAEQEAAAAAAANPDPTLEPTTEPAAEPSPAPEPALRKAVQIAGHSNALSVMCDDGTVWLWTSYDGWTPYKTIPQTPIQ